MASSSGRNFEVRVLLSKGKRAAAAYIHADVVNPTSPNHLQFVLDCLLNPAKSIDEWETIDWCKWLMAGGRTPDEFSSIGIYITFFSLFFIFIFVVRMVTHLPKYTHYTYLCITNMTSVCVTCQFSGDFSGIFIRR